jgi:pimeloyl-ACP methyl ester carboxylesterase
VDGFPTAVQRVGTGAPLLVIHPSLAAARAMLPLVQALNQGAVLFDMPGHGGSADWDGRGDYQTVTAGIAAALAPPCAHVIGHSFGATVALRLAVDRPDKVARLTLVEPVFFAAARGTPAWDAHRTAFRPFEAAVARQDWPAAAAAFNALWGAAPWDSLPDRARAAMVRRIPLIPAGAPAIEDDNAGLLASGLLTRLTCPVTLIRGADSPPVIAAIHARLAALIPGATDHVIPGAGHMVPITHPRAVAGVIITAETLFPRANPPL